MPPTSVAANLYRYVLIHRSFADFRPRSSVDLYQITPDRNSEKIERSMFNVHFLVNPPYETMPKWHGFLTTKLAVFQAGGGSVI